jgi:hypothetical protein
MLLLYRGPQTRTRPIILMALLAPSRKALHIFPGTALADYLEQSEADFIAVRASAFDV